MKLLLFSDVHISPRGEFSSPTSDGMTDYLSRVEKSLEFVIECIEDNNPDAVAFLGDLFESTGYIDTASLKVATKFLNKLFSYKSIVTMFVVGNHDSYSVNHKIHNLEFIKLNPTYIADEPMKLNIKGCNILLLPWTDDYGSLNMKELMKDIDVCLSHVDVFGIPYVHGTKKSDKGILLGDCKVHVFNGHYHNPGDVKSAEWFHNVGALLSRDFRDSGSSIRGVVLADISKKKVSHKLIGNPHDIPFVDLVLDEKSVDEWKNKAESGECELDVSFVRIRCDEEYRSIAEKIGFLTAGSKIETIPKKLISNTGGKLNESFSVENNFTKYVDEIFVLDEEGDKEKIVTSGMGYIEKARKEQSQVHSFPIQFVSFSARNFQSLGEVNVSLDDPGFVYVEGPNGSGKSSLPEGIFWCMTGKSLRELVGDDVINWNYDWCSAESSFFVGENKFSVLRGRGPKKLVLKKWEGDKWEDISCRLDDDTNEQIQKLLGRSRDVLQHSVFLNSDLNTRFTKLSFPDRIRLIEQVTNSEIYSDVYKLVDGDYSKKKKETLELSAKIDSINDTLLSYKDRIVSINGEINEEKRNSSEELNGLKAKLSFLLNGKSEKESEEEKISKEISSVQNALDSVEDNVRNAMDRVKEIEKNYYVCHSQVQELAKNIRMNEANILAGDCPVCGQKISKDTPISVHTKELKEQLKNKEEEEKSLKEMVDENVPKFKSLESERKRVYSGFLALQGKHKNILLEIRKVEAEIEQVKRWMHEKRSSISELEAKKEEIKRLTGEARELLESKEKELVNKNSELYNLKILLDAFGTNGIRTKMLTTVTFPFVNKRVEEYSMKFGFPFQLSNQRETKGGSLQDKIDIILPGKRTYKSCSRGEKRKIDLSIQLAINDLAVATGGGKINLLILDEVIDCLDDAAVQVLIDILSDKAEDMKILFMSHKPMLSASFTKRWVLIKQGDVTNLEMLNV